MNTLTANPLIPVPHRVHAVRKETADTFTLDVAPNEGSPPPQYEPGQFNMLYAFGVGDVPISISGRSPKTGGWLHTVRDVGTVTGALHALKAGQTVGLRGPFGTSWPMPQAAGKDVIIMAGGIGLAPLRPVLEVVVENRDRFGNVSLLYGARNPDGLLFERDRELWRGKHGIKVKVTVDTGSREWKGNVGVVTHLVNRVNIDPAHTIAMVCGPEIMMKFAVRELLQAGVAEDRVFISMERNMKCAVGFCGHCQYGPAFICKDGPVFSFDQVAHLLKVREL